MTVFHCTHAKTYNPKKHDDIKGWLCFEKHDGLRGLWKPDKKAFFSKSNKIINAPPFVIEQMSNVEIELDGELCLGRGQFQKCMSVTSKKNPTDLGWENVQYKVFDSLAYDKSDWYDRIKKVEDSIKGLIFPSLLEHKIILNHNDARKEFMHYTQLLGEGIILRNPEAPYEFKKSSNLLKWKDRVDGLAIVVSSQRGTPGKANANRMGALFVKEVDNNLNVVKWAKEFKIGIGFTFEDRERDDWIGKVIRWDANDYTNSLIPRHAAYRCIYEG